MRTLHFHPLLLAGMLGGYALAAAAAEENSAEQPVVQPAEESASAPIATPSDNTLAALPGRIEDTLDSWQDFLDSLLLDALGPNPERRYRVFGQRRTVDLGKKWTLALDERQIGRLNSAGVGIPAAGQPARTWELLHDGHINQFRFYNQRDGSGRENGGAITTRLTDNLAIHTHGLKLHDDALGVSRTDAQTGLRAGSSELWVEGFVRHARLDDMQSRENWNDPKPKANFGGVQAQWEAAPGLTFGAEHQSAIRSKMAPGDERLSAARTEFGADYRPGGSWSGSRVYWREATQLGLLSSAGVDERTTYKRVVGAEVPEGSPDGLVYAQVRQRSLVDDRDALLVLGWRHTEDFAPKWRAQTLIESGIPIGGDNAVRSNTADLRIINNDFPRHLFVTELEGVRTPFKNSAFASVDYTQRLTRNSLFVTRATASGMHPQNSPGEVPVNSGDAMVGWGWQRPSEHLFSTFWRYTFVRRNALVDGIQTPDVADRRAHIGASEFIYQASDRLNLMLHASRRWERDDSFNGGAQHTTDLTVLRPTQQLAERWHMSLQYARLTDSAKPSQAGYGTELSVQMNHKIVLTLAYNIKGIDDGELAGDDRIGRGVKLRLYIPTEATLTHWLRPGSDADRGIDRR